jgi:hypothetical protein
MAITPNRVTTLTLDIDETGVIDPGFSIVRTGADIAKRAVEGLANPSEFTHMHYWQPGVWTLEPLQFDIANIQETTTGLSHVIRKSAWNFVQFLGPSGNQDAFIEEANWAKSDVPGSDYDGTVPASGDYFLKLSIPATGSCDPGVVSANATFDSGGPDLIALPVEAVPFDRVAVTSASFPTNQPFFVRFKADYSATTHPRYLWGLLFGEYEVVFGGTGWAYLWEFCKPSGSDTPRWVQRYKFRYADIGAAANNAHSLGIMPFYGPDGTKHISLVNVSANRTQGLNTGANAGVNSAVTDEHTYRFDRIIRGDDQDMSPGYATASNKLRIDLRRGLRLAVQISKLGFETSGTLIDDDTVVGSGAWTGNTNAPVGTINAVTDLTYTISPTIQDADTGGAFTPGTSVFPRVSFAFAGDGNNSPQLWGYALRQAAVTETASPGSFTVPVQSVGIDCFTGEPSTEVATISAFDIDGVHARLTKRGRFSSLLTTTYTPSGGSEKTVVLFNGICRKPRGTKKSGIVQTWNNYNLTIAGQWDKLSERVQGATPRTFALDDSSASLTWKITDAVKFVLAAAGYTSGQINIPDLGYRFWPAYTSKVSDIVIDPTASLAEFLVNTVHEQLGAYLYFEPNAGAHGQWIILWPATPAEDGTFTPVYNFVTAPQSGWPSDPYSPASYDDNTTFITDGIEYTQNAPDFNAIWVSTGMPTTDERNRSQIVGFAANPLSYAVPGMTTAPNPNHPDYIGHAVVAVLIKPELQCDNYNDTQFAVNWATRRLYNFYCHGQRICTFRAPLPIVYDATISSGASGGYRPLRFQDPIAIDGDNTWVVKSISAGYSSDQTQACTIEAIQPFPGQFFFGFEGKEEHRRMSRGRIMRHAGINTSASFGAQHIAGHKTHEHLALPVVRGGFSKLQNVDGSFISISGWNTIDGSSG